MAKLEQDLSITALYKVLHGLLDEDPVLFMKFIKVKWPNTHWKTIIEFCLMGKELEAVNLIASGKINVRNI